MTWNHVAPIVSPFLFGLFSLLGTLNLVGCEKETPVDTGDTVDTQDDDTEDSWTCHDENVIIDVLGPAEPVVGDTWTVWMRCEGVTLIGAMILQFKPRDFAYIESNNATFNYAGEAVMTLQVGRHVAHMDVLVREAKDDE
jgi:hypothetical protein